jgi:2Fe-2S ferredoxin
MIKITVLPHETLCPAGVVIDDATPGQSICRILLDHDIDIEHACEMSCACTTCHVVVREGGSSLNAASEDEEDMLDKAWGLTAQSRLSCQAIVGTQDLVVEIPKYTINLAREHHS